MGEPDDDPFAPTPAARPAPRPAPPAPAPEPVMAQIRTPPANATAERSVLGAPLIDPTVFRSEIAAELTADDFSLPAHREVYLAMEAIDGRDAPIDFVTLAEELRARGALGRLEGGEAYLIALASALPSVGNVEHYVEIVRDKATLRRLISVCSEAMSRAYGDVGPGQAAEHLADHSEAVTKIALRSRGARRTRSMASLAPAVIDAVEERCRAARAGRTIDGVRFGADPLDHLIGGVKVSEQCVLAGEVGSGKTALAVQAAITNAMDGGASLVFTLEMTEAQLGERVLIHRGEVNSHSVRRGELDHAAWRRFFDAGRRAASEPWGSSLAIDGEARSMRQIEAKARHWRAQNPKARGLIVLDFLQLMQMAQARGDTRATAVAAAAYGFKGLLKELDVAGILLSQLNREGKKGHKGRDGVVVKTPPTKHDLKESAAIEESADYIVLLWNPESSEDGEMDAIVDKARGGVCRTVKLHWVGRHYKFKNPESWVAPSPPREWVNGA